MDAFAPYVAKRYMADKGFGAGVPVEAAPLAEVCDVVLSYSDGLTFSLLCIVDAEGDASKRWPLDQDRVVEVARECLKYTGRMNGAKMPVVVQILEVRPSIEADDRRRLKRLQRIPGLSKIGVTALAAAPATGEAWSSAPLGFFQERALREMMREPRRSDAELAAPEAEIGAGVERPWLTYAMLALLAGIFAAELALAASPPPRLLAASVPTLVALGGLGRSLVVEQGEWHRLLTATLLHGDVIHLALNGFALFLAGTLLETLLGRAWLGALFLIGALGGSLLGLAVNDAHVVSVGASGAIMGLLAAALVAIQRLPARERPQVMMPLLQVLVPSLIPLATYRPGGQIDYAAHIGGAAAGALAGLGLLRIWPRGARVPGHTRGALAVSALAAGLYLFGIARVAEGYPTYSIAMTAKIIPNEELRTIDTTDADELVARYPRDPRARLVAAGKAAARGDMALAERHLREGLAEEAILGLYFPDRRLEARMRAVLAEVLEADGRPADARAAARPACDVAIQEIARFCR